MNRRTFVNSSILSSAGIGLGLQSCKEEANSINRETDIIEKVKIAMLSMQRASWEQGVAVQSLMELGQNELAYMMAKEAVLRQTKEGRLAVLYTDNGITDPASSGMAVNKMGEKYEDKSLVDAAKKMYTYLQNEAPRNSEGTLYHTLRAPELWIDSMYMAPPFIAAMENYKDAIQQINGLRNFLWNDEHQLFSHRWSDKKNDFVNKDFWGVGNGWAAVGITQVILELPETANNEIQILKNYVIEILEGCFKYLREDYLFHNNVNDPTSFVETNLSQMLAYTIYRNCNYGLIPNQYIEIADKMRSAAHNKIDKYGYVQDVCGAPYFRSPGRATEGQACFLLMEAAHRDFHMSN
jgi:rhamnogalacturonyl hydrolase YesR